MSKYFVHKSDKFTINAVADSPEDAFAELGSFIRELEGDGEKLDWPVRIRLTLGSSSLLSPIAYVFHINKVSDLPKGMLAEE